MKRRKSLIFLFPVFFLFTCGLEEDYYLPQVPKENIITSFTDNATIYFDSLSQYYARYYSIFYRIYISGQETTDPNDRSNINSRLSTDYNDIYPYSDPINTTATASIGTIFRNKNYYELELFDDKDKSKINSILSTNGGTITIQFPTLAGDRPVLTHVINNNANDPKFELKRSSNLSSPQPSSDLSFLNSTELSDSGNAIIERNADVQSGSGAYTYVSMYIVAVGQDGTTFSPVYSKPTHINVFRLP